MSTKIALRLSSKSTRFGIHEVYKLSQPWCGNKHVVVSSVEIEGHREVAIFPSNKHGEFKDSDPLDSTYEHASGDRFLEKLGYNICDSKNYEDKDNPMVIEVLIRNVMSWFRR